MKMVRNFASKLRNRIEIFTNIAEGDIGFENWVKCLDLYAEILSITENNIKEFDSINFGHIMSEEYYIITFRYVENINYKMRIKFGNRIFLIKKIINPYEQNRYLKVIALEITEK